jgi:Flp pilus assembly protein TadB
MTVSPLNIQPNDDPTDLSTESLVAELSRSSLSSEQVILEAPMSFTGCTKRTLRFAGKHQCTHWWSKALAGTGLMFWLLLAYVSILTWYLFFGLLLVPYRLIRRSQRKNEKESRQHAELLAQLGKNQRAAR